MSAIVWQNLDGSIHTTGGYCPSCRPTRCLRCNRIGVRHYQPMYGSYADPCEFCDYSDWQPGPVPPHDQGIAR